MINQKPEHRLSDDVADQEAVIVPAIIFLGSRRIIALGMDIAARRALSDLINEFLDADRIVPIEIGELWEALDRVARASAN
jgi:hypothetical protein